MAAFTPPRPTRPPPIAPRSLKVVEDGSTAESTAEPAAPPILAPSAVPATLAPNLVALASLDELVARVARGLAAALPAVSAPYWISRGPTWLMAPTAPVVAAAGAAAAAAKGATPATNVVAPALSAALPGLRTAELAASSLRASLCDPSRIGNPLLAQ